MTDTTTILIVGTIGITTTPTMTAAPVSATLIATGNRATDAAPMTHENATLVVIALASTLKITTTPTTVVLSTTPLRQLSRPGPYASSSRMRIVRWRIC